MVLNASGQFGITAQFDPGEYDVRVKGKCWLRKTVRVTLGSGGIGEVQVSLLAGDIDDDNEVGIADYAILSGSYNLSEGDSGFISEADLNGDTTVDIADYAILSANYGLTGDE